jgi:hypothetical protein
LWIALSGNAYKVSVTGFTFLCHMNGKYSADWLAALATQKGARLAPRVV